MSHDAIIQKLEKLKLPVNITNYAKLCWLGSRSFRSLSFEEREEIRYAVERARRARQ